MKTNVFFKNYRYKVIVYSTGGNRNTPKLWATILSLVCIWVIAILLSFPLFLGMDMFVNDLNSTMGSVVAGCIKQLTGRNGDIFKHVIIAA